jgi:uncharacterized OB-fold protein
VQDSCDQCDHTKLRPTLRFGTKCKSSGSTLLHRPQLCVDCFAGAHSAQSAKERRLYTTLELPISDFGLELVFSRYGQVDFVRLRSGGRHGVVQFATAEAAAAALAGLDGTKLLGQVCRCQACSVQHFYAAPGAAHLHEDWATQPTLTTMLQ